MTITHRTLQTNGISMHVAEAGQGRPVILCHGFPELWYSWRHQMPALAGAGYRVVAPDQRGYGDTDAPPRVEDYDVVQLTGDLVGLLDDLGEEKAVFVGHDWGALVVWQMALLHPGRVDAVVGMSVPYSPRAPMQPTTLFKNAFGDTFFYILYFQKVGPADTELDADATTSMRKIMCGIGGGGQMRVLPKDGTGFLDMFGEPDWLPGWITEQDIEKFASAFAKSGFTGGLNWYRNFDRNWELTPQLEGAKVTQPALFVAGAEDPVIRMANLDGMKQWVTDLRGTVLLPGAGHWTQQERPDEVNRALLDFLASLPPR